MSNLPNIRYNHKFVPEEIGRLGFVLTNKDSGAANSIAVADAGTLANWQTLFNTFNFASDTSIKVVMTPRIYNVTPERGDPVEYDNYGYYRKLGNGDYDFTFLFIDPNPGVIADMQALEDYDVSVFMYTTDPRVLGSCTDETNLVPYAVQNLNVQNWGPAGHETASEVQVKFRLKAGTSLNNTASVAIANADINLDTDFYALRDSSTTTASPAVTGCDFTPTVDDLDPNNPSTAIPITGITYDEITFVKVSDSSEVTLAASGSLTYSGGTYTVNEGALLSADTDYYLQIEHDGFDITRVTISVPA
jgi:hypothetical protein